MFADLDNSLALLKQSRHAFLRHPGLFLPLLVYWQIYAFTIVFFQFYFPIDLYDEYEFFFVFVLVILFLSIFASFLCFALLEKIKKIETNQRVSTIPAFRSVILSVLRALPVTILWAFILCFLSIIEGLLKATSMIRKSTRNGREQREQEEEKTAQTLSGYEKFSFSLTFFEAFKNGVRMLAFLVYPAIIWEGLSTAAALKKGMHIAKAHKAEFAAAHRINKLMAVLIVTPPTVLYFLSSKMDSDFSAVTACAATIYIGLAWSFSLFLEQICNAELYLWHLMWEKECGIAADNGREIPELAAVRRPSILDEFADLLKLSGDR